MVAWRTTLLWGLYPIASGIWVLFFPESADQVMSAASSAVGLPVPAKYRPVMKANDDATVFLCLLAIAVGCVTLLCCCFRFCKFE